jgi:hypothetical protein
MPRVSLPTADRARVHDPAHGTCSHHRANRWSCRRCGRPRTRPRPTEQRRETVGGPLRARPRDQRASHPGANRLGPVRRTRVGHRLRRALRDRFPDRLDDDLPQRLPDVHRCFLSSAPAADRSTGAHRLPGSTHVRGGQAHPAAGPDTVAAMAAASESEPRGRGKPWRAIAGTSGNGGADATAEDVGACRSAAPREGTMPTLWVRRRFSLQRCSRSHHSRARGCS